MDRHNKQAAFRRFVNSLCTGDYIEYYEGTRKNQSEDGPVEKHEGRIESVTSCLILVSPIKPFYKGQIDSISLNSVYCGDMVVKRIYSGLDIYD